MRVSGPLIGTILNNWTVLAHSTAPSAPQSPLIACSGASSDLLSLHKSLVEHSSITYHEHSVAQFLTSYLQHQNFTVETQPVAGRARAHAHTQTQTQTQSKQAARHNVLAYVGQTRKTRTLVTSHIDTVPPFWPYERRGPEIWGRGSVDAKGSVAAQVKAVEALRASGAIAEGDVAMLFVVGEELGGDGMRAASDGLGLAWETVIFGEPTELKLASGHKGTVGVRIRATGKAGHSGYPELGRNANSMLVKALYALDRVELPWSEKYGNTTLNIGKMGGGVAQNVIAEQAEAQLQIRIAAGEPADVEKVILETLEKVGEELDVSFSPGYGPIDIDHDVEGEL